MRGGQNKIEMAGKRFGHLLVIKEAGRNKGLKVRWECICDCGKITIVDGCNLRNGNTKSCRCRCGEKNDDNHKKNAQKVWREENKEKKSALDTKYRKANGGKVRRNQAKFRRTHPGYGAIGRQKNAKFDTYAEQLWTEKVRRDPNNRLDLQVICALCGKFFTPTSAQAGRRLSSINSKKIGDSNFYCSDNCKKACPVFWTKKYRKGDAPQNSTRRPGQAEWRKHVIVCAEYTCERCGKVLEEKDLSAHHIKSVSQYPSESMDIDNGMALCKDCHALVHSEMGCRPIDLRCNAK